MKKKLIIALVLCIVLGSFTTVSMAENSPAGEKSFSLAEAVDYALKNSPQMGIKQTALEKAKVGLREANSLFNKTKDSSEVTFQTAQIKKGYGKRGAQSAVTVAEKDLLRAAEDIKYSVESSYFNLLNAQEKLEIQNSTLVSAKENLDTTSKKYELGLVSQIEVTSAKTTYMQEQMDQRSAQRAVEYAVMDFNKTLGLPLETKVKLTDTLNIEPLPEVDINEKVSLALQNRMEIVSASEQYEVDKLNLEITYGWYPENTYKYQEAKQTMESSEYKLSSSKQSVELSVRKAYMDMQDAYDRLTILDQSIDEMEKLYDATILKYENGLDTSSSVTDMLNKVKEVKLQKAQALLGYNLAKKQFEASFGIGISSAGGY
ncbi:outer membrane efflux protein [Oxobacter pfennigii]|uniref:Outer membrane efflux protein n=1 Tax=Oxobacter pfennigii TaxID=36849 RepID=A0A0P9AEC5_9CLOT|nr:TolC family protein [Oxobacter pfennigii]KPU43671.1 outer membrane efflux protein [Oxobacter pfennigii]